MLCFIRRSFELDNDKALHNKQLRNSAYSVLTNMLREHKMDFAIEDLCYGEHGKPFLKDCDNLFFNISHCRGLAVCAVETAETGVDVEYIREYPSGVLKRAFSEKEKEIIVNAEKSHEMFFRIWTLKESFVKALGIGISYPLKTAEFLISDNSIISEGCEGYYFLQFLINREFICSLCIKGQNENRVFETESDKEIFNLSF